MKKVVIAYIPVLHDGYRKFLDSHQDSNLFIFGPEIISKFDHLSKEIRALDPNLVLTSIKSWDLKFKKIELLNAKNLKELSSEKNIHLYIPSEDVTKSLIKKYFPNHKVTEDSVFLRWDRTRSTEQKPVEVDQTISEDEFDQELISLAKNQANKSSDWWRHVGAVIVKDNKVSLSSFNFHTPSPHSPYVEGDPRNNFSSGEFIEHSTALHAEAGIIAQAAKKGTSLSGASIYVSTFPCPPCAKLIAYSGINKLFYTGGYSLLNQEKVLRSQGVKIIYVKPKDL